MDCNLALYVAVFTLDRVHSCLVSCAPNSRVSGSSRVIVHHSCYLLQSFFETELVNHFDPARIAKITQSKRQLTYFLSYLSRIAFYWDSCKLLKMNVHEAHYGSILFEHVRL